ncbi:MAG: TonB family protein [Deltaproteobacteria bacterium]|nr:TonB family protein [Deltaproteobacteria bacterium]
MDSKKAILWPVIASIFIHVTLLAVTGMIDLRDNIKPVEIFSVSIKEPEPEEKPAPKKEIKTKEKIKLAQPSKEKGVSVNDDDWREETIDLGSLDIKYVSYLAKIKNKIIHIWKYPQKAYERNEEGNVVVKMSVDADGNLAGATLISSSGYAQLDDGAVSVVRAAAPFEPLPEIYNLSRLNIIASFHYKIMD